MVERTWAKHPDANIGVLCGGGLIVVESDSLTADAALREYCLPPTTTVRTARGTHYYLAGDSRNRAGIIPDVDVRGAGGYVLGAGSIHPSGAVYTYVVPPREVSPAPVPKTITELLATRRGRKALSIGSSGQAAVPPPDLSAQVIPEGLRNTTLHRIASWLRGRLGLDTAEMTACLRVVNDSRCRPPLSDDELATIVASAVSYDTAPPWVLEPYGFACDPNLTSTERHLLMGLARYADDAGKCYPGVRRLHQDTGINRNAIQRCIGGLEAAGRIAVERGNRQQSNRYRLFW